MTLDAYVGYVGRLDALPAYDSPDDSIRNQLDANRMLRELQVEESVRILPEPAE